MLNCVAIGSNTLESNKLSMKTNGAQWCSMVLDGPHWSSLFLDGPQALSTQNLSKSIGLARFPGQVWLACYNIRLPEPWALPPKWVGYLRFESPMSSMKGSRLLSFVKRSGRLARLGSCSIGRVMSNSLTLIVLLRSLRKPNMPLIRSMGFLGIIPACPMSKKSNAVSVLLLEVASPIPLILKRGVA